MGFTEWADKQGIATPTIRLGRWLREHPEVAAEAVKAWRAGYTPDDLVAWLSDEHGVVTDRETLRRRIAEWERAQ